MTRKQMREAKRQEKLASREQQSQRRSRRKIVVALVIVVGIVGIGLLIALAGNSGSTGDSGSVDTIADPVRGNPDATVVVKEYSDFQCPACRAAEPLVDSLLTQYGDRIRLEYNDFPLKSIHRNAEAAAIAANCAARQEGKYWDYHNLLFTNQSSWEGLGSSDLTATFMTYATQLEMDTEAFTTCVDTQATKGNVEEDVREASRRKVGSTPTFFVGDERIVGANQTALSAAIEKVLTQ